MKKKHWKLIVLYVPLAIWSFLLVGRLMEHAEKSAWVNFFREADLHAQVTVYQCVSKQDGLFAHYETVLFHTSDTTMQKFVQYYKFDGPGFDGPGRDTFTVSSNELLNTASPPYRALVGKPVAIFGRVFEDPYHWQTLYWDAQTGTGYLDDAYSD